MLAGALAFALSGAATKYAADSLSTEAIAFWRSAISLAILAPWALARRRRWLRAENMRLIGLRALTMLVSIYCYYYAISAIPLANAVLLVFSSPIFVPIIGFLAFGFALDRRVLLAVLIGFLGVSLILQPGPAALDIGTLMGLLAGIAGAVGVVVMWRMPADEDPGRIAFFVGLISAAVFAAPAAASGGWPVGAAWWPLIALGAFSTAAHLLLAYACLIAPADRIITLEYATVAFAAVLGWVLWAEQPGLTLLIGGALIVGAGIIVLRSPARPPAAETPRRRSRSPSADGRTGGGPVAAQSGMPAP